jgi:imidazole glycerol-phosphate synthase subunit HisH
MIGVLDLGFGNIGSVVNMLKRVGAPVQAISNEQGLEDSKCIMLPGVGKFDHCLETLKSDSSFFEKLENRVLVDKTPFLGICIGMQLLLSGSEEGYLPGLGWIEGKVRRFEFDSHEIKVPHMGWSELILNCSKHSYFEASSRFYFVHSYYVESVRQEHVLSYADYHGKKFVSAIRSENLTAVQFHPEKSNVSGIKFFKEYLKNNYE